MKVSTFLTIKAIVSLVFGIAFVLLPKSLMGLYGVTLAPAGILVGGFAGAVLIGVALICWLGRALADDARKVITLALFIADTIGFIVALKGQLSGLMNPLGWITVVIWLLLAVGNGYCRFQKLGAA